MSYYAREPYDDPTFDLDRHMAAARRYERRPCPLPADRPTETAGGSDLTTETPGPALDLFGRLAR